MYCLNGKVSISIETIGDLPFECSSTEIIPYGSQVDIAAAAHLRVVVTPSDGAVTWALSVGE